MDNYTLDKDTKDNVFVVEGGVGGLGHVVLQEVGVAASGSYSCEAVADFPSFSQHLVTANLTVVGKLARQRSLHSSPPLLYILP